MMFRQRVFTAVVLIPLVLFIIYFTSSGIFASLVFLLMLCSALEWLRLIPLKRFGLKLIFLTSLLVMTWVMHFNFDYWLVLNFILWALIIIALINFPNLMPVWGHPSVVFLAGLFVLPLFSQSLLKLHAYKQGKDLIVYLLLIVWAADIGAYLTGKKWGSKKLIPLVSPGKTIEGALGGFLLSMLIAISGYFYFNPHDLMRWFLLAIMVTVISIIGDLFISMLKRRVKIKDTGHLLPGHGGILDRLDSLIAALPLFNYGLLFLAPGL